MLNNKSTTLTYEQLIVNNKNLILENKSLRDKINQLRDIQSYEICEYFNRCRSIKKVCDKYLFNNVSECYYALYEYLDSSEPLRKAYDYSEYYNVIFTGKEDDELEVVDLEEDENEDNNDDEENNNDEEYEQYDEENNIQEDEDKQDE